MQNSENEQIMKNNNDFTNGTAPFGILLKTFGILIIVLILLICMISFLPGMFGWKTANIISGSMQPEIPVGSLVLVAPCSSEELDAGDIIMYRSGGSDITHRVVSNDVQERTLITKGDANEREDLSPVFYDQVEGVIRLHLPAIGNLLQFIGNTTGKIYTLGILVLGVVLVFLGGTFRRRD